jgi:hypothetical protein
MLDKTEVSACLRYRIAYGKQLGSKRCRVAVHESRVTSV